MLEVLEGFIGELRAAGLPVSVRESIDAAQAVQSLGLDDRSVLKAALGATLTKTLEHRGAFESAFEIYFSRHHEIEVLPSGLFGGESDESGSGLDSLVGSGRGTGELETEDVNELVNAALETGTPRAFGLAANAAVARYGAIDATRPVGVSYYLQRTLRGLDLDALVAQFLAEVLAEHADESDLARRLIVDEYHGRAQKLRERIEEEIKRQLVSHRGAAAVAKSLRRPLLDDVDFMHASANELASMRHAIYPLARVLAARLARRRRHRRHGPLDFRATVRRSLSTGGVPIEPRFRPPHPVRPEIFLLADVSGSVASFARFTVHLVYAISAQFSKVRAVLFIDGIDEVTEIFQRSASISEALARMSEEADVVAADGHSDYGNAFALFKEKHLRDIGAWTNVIILGDARNNYHATNASALEDLRQRARRVYWLNPEPRSYWGSGDSVIEEYAPYCDAVFECRNLRQLKSFVDELV